MPTTNPKPAVPLPEDCADLETLDTAQLATILGRAVKTVAMDVTRRPDTLPPVFRIPGCSTVRFRKVDVRRWMEALAAVERDRRARQAEFAVRFPAPKGAVFAEKVSRRHHVDLSDPDKGEAASAKLREMDATA